MKLSEIKKIAEERSKAIDLLAEYNKLIDKKDAAEKVYDLFKDYCSGYYCTLVSSKVKVIATSQETGKREETVISLSKNELLAALKERVAAANKDITDFCDQNNVQLN